MNDWNDAMTEAPTPVEPGLEMLARRLDEQRYPGQAWTPPTRRGLQPPRLGRLSAWIAAGATAAAVACAVNLRSSPKAVTSNRSELVQDRVDPSAATTVGDTMLFPGVFVVEDLDCYSIVDTTGDVAVVSFATKGGYGPEWLVTLPGSPSPYDR